MLPRDRDVTAARAESEMVKRGGKHPCSEQYNLGGGGGNAPRRGACH